MSVIIIIMIAKLTARQLKMNTVLVVPKNWKNYFRVHRIRVEPKKHGTRKSVKVMVSNAWHQ